MNFGLGPQFLGRLNPINTLRKRKIYVPQFALIRLNIPQKDNKSFLKISNSYF